MSTPPPASARDLLAPRVILDSTLPPVVFVAANAAGGLPLAAGLSVGLAVALTSYRLVRGQRPLYAVSGLFGVLIGVGFALLSRSATGFFVPGIITNIVMAVASVVSILVRRPLLALTGAALYRWPLAWYWHPRVRPAYSEATWVWAAFYAGRGWVQAELAARGELGLLTAARLGLGWPAFAVLVVGTYAYINWRLRVLGGPDVEEFR